MTDRPSGQLVGQDVDADRKGGQRQHIGDEGVEDLEAVVIVVAGDRIRLTLLTPDVYSSELCSSEI